MRLKLYPFCIWSSRGFHRLYNNHTSAVFYDLNLFGGQKTPKCGSATVKQRLWLVKQMSGIFPKTSAVCSVWTGCFWSGRHRRGFWPGWSAPGSAPRPPAWLMGLRGVQGVDSLKPCNTIWRHPRVRVRICSFSPLLHSHLYFFFLHGGVKDIKLHLV